MQQNDRTTAGRMGGVPGAGQTRDMSQMQGPPAVFAAFYWCIGAAGGPLDPCPELRQCTGVASADFEWRNPASQGTLWSPAPTGQVEVPAGLGWAGHSRSSKQQRDKEKEVALRCAPVNLIILSPCPRNPSLFPSFPYQGGVFVITIVWNFISVYSLASFPCGD